VEYHHVLVGLVTGHRAKRATQTEKKLSIMPAHLELQLLHN